MPLRKLRAAEWFKAAVLKFAPCRADLWRIVLEDPEEAGELRVRPAALFQFVPLCTNGFGNKPASRLEPTRKPGRRGEDEGHEIRSDSAASAHHPR